jgi:hypothetical protein
MRGSPICIGCGKKPDEIAEYVEASKPRNFGGRGCAPDEYVRREEGTYNPETNRFACTSCYIDMGMPTAPGRGWFAS